MLTARRRRSSHQSAWFGQSVLDRLAGGGDDPGMTLKPPAVRRGALVGAVALLALAGVQSQADAGIKLPCTASMSNPYPAQNSTTNALVKTTAAATVTTVAHYKTTNTTHTAKSNGSGRATIAYKISRATRGYRVVVSVRVKKGSAAGSCSTSFTTA